jgi:MATE family multidrug resistance protein
MAQAGPTASRLENHQPSLSNIFTATAAGEEKPSPSLGSMLASSLSPRLARPACGMARAPPPDAPSDELKTDRGSNVPHRHDYSDISSLALTSVPFPFIVGGAAFTMDALGGPRRFSSTGEERVGLLSDPTKQDQYATIPDPSELERLVAPDGTVEVRTTAGNEAKILLKSSIPLMITYVLQYTFSLVTIFVVGHIGTDELGAVSLATMTANITGLAVYEGLATSLDTLCAQAYGSGRKTLVGLHLQRMVILMMLVTVPIGAMWLCSGWILAALVPEKDLAHLAGKYLSLLLAGAPGYAIFEAGKR